MQPTGAGAQPLAEPAPLAPGPAAEPTTEPTAEPKAGKDSDDPDDLDVEGRVFARSTLTRDDREADSGEPWLHELAVESARITVDYKRGRFLRVQIEAEMSDDELRTKDAYVRLRPNEHWTFQAGRFKRPLSAIALSSIWDLPVVERGLLSELEPDSSVPLPFGGRDDGASVSYEPGLPWEPAFTAALFMHTLTDVGVVDVSEVFAMDAHLRATVKPVDSVTVGVSGASIAHRETRALDPDNLSNAPLGSIDVEAELGPVALWVEGFIGESTAYTTIDRAEGTMWAARMIAAFRLKKPLSGVRQLEPFVAGSLFDPRTSTSGDGARQLAGGLNVYFTKRVRLNLEVENTWISDPNLLLRASHIALYTQLGAKF
jgi:hypothetical protein